LPKLSLLAVVVASTAMAFVAPGSAGAEVAPFGHPCKAQDGVRFCPTETLAQRVPSFDGVPLDVDVTLPATGAGHFPTIVMLHGWEGNKTSFEATTPQGDGNETFDYNNIYYAQHGFAVINYSARGWGRSCGSEESREASPGCEEGWLRLGDQRYEARDTQYLLGLLADQGIISPKQIGVTGISYGGGQSIELAYLKNRVRLPAGELEPWRSPAGKKMAIKAAFPRWPWSDLVNALLPNGRFLSSEIAPHGQSYEPFGVEIQSYVTGLYAAAKATNGYIAPLGKDSEAELTGWYTLINAGEPYETSEAEALAHQIYEYHQGYGLPGKPASMLLESGWTDDLFPVEQSLRVYNQVRAMKGYVALMFGDLGHGPASNKVNTDEAFNEEGAAFFAAKLKHEGKAPKSGSVTAYTQTCPVSALAGGPYTATTFAKLSKHSLTFGASAGQTFTSAGGNPTIATEFDPIVLGEESESEGDCHTATAETEPDTANYTMTSPGFTLLGLPTVSTTITTTGAYGQIDARLWDILPSGEQRLISRGVYRLGLNQTGQITFQLHGNAYEFAKGDTVKLQLLGKDAPYYRASNGTFTVEASNTQISLPAA
jgi:predicted acyl esterase